jgi:hypothetical protein
VALTPILYSIIGGIMSFSRACTTGKLCFLILILNPAPLVLMVQLILNLSFSSNHPTLRQKGLVIKEKVVNFLLEINYSS